MKKSTPAFLFISLSKVNSILKTFFRFICLLHCLLMAAPSGAQVCMHSVGPAPAADYRINTVPVPFQIGTRYFAQVSISPNFQFGRAFMESCAITNIGPGFTIPFSGGLLYMNGIVYTWNQSPPFQVWSIDTVTGTHTIHLASLTGVPQTNLTGMCWDGVNVYGVSTSVSNSQIFIINWSYGTCVPIGVPSTSCAGAIFLLGRLGAGSNLFSADIVSDNFFRWNKTTGAATLIGPLGVNINFGQDGSVDPNDNTFYWAAYSTGPELRRLDTNGSSVVLCNYQSQVTGIACVPHSAFPGVTLCRNGLNVPILDFSTARDSVFVNLGGCTITDVNVRIDTVLHTWDSDLRFYIQRGTVGALVINNVGGGGGNFIGTILDDEATTPIASGTPPFTGSFIPSNPLTVFDGAGSSVYWKILITDTAGGDEGVLKAWCLVISYNCPTGGVKTIEVPNYYFLNQNYPNPFNPITIIKFGVPERENIKLVVYDILGREVKTLLNEYKTPGTYEASFDASELSSGVYFYRIEAGKFTDVKKMLLVK